MPVPAPEAGWWPAPTMPGAVATASTISMPGSKSLTARWLIVAATGFAPVYLAGALDCEDTRAMSRALSSLGAQISWDDAGCAVTPFPRDTRGRLKLSGNISIDAGQAGTVMRFLLPLAAMADGDVYIHCADNAQHRPIAGLVAALADMGVQISAEIPDSPETAYSTKTAIHFPLTVHGHGHLNGGGHLDGGAVSIDAHASSQFISALLLAGPHMTSGLSLKSTGAFPSAPHVDMTVSVLREAGYSVVVHNSDGHNTNWKVAPAEKPATATTATTQPTTIQIEPDLSNVGPFLAAAMITGGEVNIANWPENSTQPGTAYCDIFRLAGGEFSQNGSTLRCQGPRELRAIDADLSEAGELVPTIAAVCGYAPGRSILRNIGHLRGHETDRLAALVSAFHALGITARATADALIIDGDPRALHCADLDSFHDHRMATFGAIVGLRTSGVRVGNIDSTAKTFPQFIGLWESMVQNGKIK